MWGVWCTRSKNSIYDHKESWLRDKGVVKLFPARKEAREKAIWCGRNLCSSPNVTYKAKKY